MKWIGQHIWDFISRFRTTVYLENLETSSDENVLVVDSDGKVTKNTSLGGADLTYNGSTANGILTYGSASTIDVESTLTYDGEGVGLGITPSASFINFGSVNTPASGWTSGTNDGFNNVTVFNNSRNTASGQTNSFKGYLIDINDSATHVGTIAYTGLDINIDFANTNGTQKTKGVSTVITDADTADMYGLWQQIEDGGKDLYFLSSDTTTVDYFSIATGASGATTLTTVDGGGSNADLTINVDGDLILNPTKSAPTIFVGDTDGTNIAISGRFHDNGDGGAVSIVGGLTSDGQTDKNGGNVNFFGGVPTGSGTWGYFTWYAGETDSSGTTYQSANAHAISLLKATGTTSTDHTWYSQAGIGGTDYFKLSVAEHGATTLSTIDNAAHAADLTLSVDGNVNIESNANKINKTYDFNSTTFENTYTDDQASGTILKYSPGNDDSLNGSEIYYLAPTGRWSQADADGVANGASQLLGVAIGGSARTYGLLLEGFVRIASTEILNTPGSGEVDGLPLYVSTTAGHFDFTAPSGSSDYVRIVGYAIDDDSSDVLVYFKPDNTWVEIA